MKSAQIPAEADIETDPETGRKARAETSTVGSATFSGNQGIRPAISNRRLLLFSHNGTVHAMAPKSIIFDADLVRNLGLKGA